MFLSTDKELVNVDSRKRVKQVDVLDENRVWELLKGVASHSRGVVWPTRFWCGGGDSNP